MRPESFLIANAVKAVGLWGLRALALRLAKGESVWTLAKLYHLPLAQIRAIDGILPAVLAYTIEETEKEEERPVRRVMSA